MPNKDAAKTKSALNKLRSLWLPICAGTVLIICIILLAISGNADPCEEMYRNDKKVTIGLSSLGAEVADTDAKRAQGLSGKTCIPANKAMLFVFDEPAQYSFWMKDMLFPIDIVWLDSNKKVVSIMDNITPDTYPQTFISDEPARYVLEIKSGRAAELGLKKGSSVLF